MPSVSKKQHNLMAMVANNPAKAKELGIPQKVGAEFTKADKGKTFKRGGDMAKANPFMEMIAKKKEMAAKKDKMPMKKTAAKKMASGGLAAGHKAADGIASKGKTKAKQVTMKKGGMKSGGYC
jgi:hypothetical protein